MTIIEALKAPEAENPHSVSVRKLHATEHVAANLVTLEPGQALKLHKTPVDAFFYLLEGRNTPSPPQRKHRNRSVPGSQNTKPHRKRQDSLRRQP